MLRPMSTLAQLRPAGTCCCSPGMKIARKYRKAHKRRLQKREYRNLQKIVPSVAHKDKVSKVTVIEEAIRYIDELHHALAKRLQATHGCPLPISVDCIEQLAQQSFLAKKQKAACPAPGSRPGLHAMFPLHLLTSGQSVPQQAGVQPPPRCQADQRRLS